jgi:hypothetical protein
MECQKLANSSNSEIEKIGLEKSEVKPVVNHKLKKHRVIRKISPSDEYYVYDNLQTNMNR